MRSRAAGEDSGRFFVPFLKGHFPLALALLLGAIQCAGEVSPNPVCQLGAAPNPALRCRGGPPAFTHLSWFCEGPVLEVELRLRSPDGQLFAQGGPFGDSRTGEWLTEPLTFYLVQTSDQRTLAKLRVGVERVDCPSPPENP